LGRPSRPLHGRYALRRLPFTLSGSWGRKRGFRTLGPPLRQPDVTFARPTRGRAARLTRPKLIRLSTCACEHCKGRAAVCMDAFNWLGRRDANHALRHAKEDLLTYFERLPAQVRDALNQADVNVCSWCAEIWVDQHGAAKAARLIRDVRYIDATRAITPIDGWDSLKGWRKEA